MTAGLLAELVVGGQVVARGGGVFPGPVAAPPVDRVLREALLTVEAVEDMRRRLVVDGIVTQALTRTVVRRRSRRPR